MLKTLLIIIFVQNYLFAMEKLNKIVLSSNQVLIWDTLEKIDKNDSIKGFGKLFNSN